MQHQHAVPRDDSSTAGLKDERRTGLRGARYDTDGIEVAVSQEVVETECSMRLPSLRIDEDGDGVSASCRSHQLGEAASYGPKEISRLQVSDNPHHIFVHSD